MNEIEIILTKLLRCDRGSLYLDKDRLPLGARDYNRLESILKKRVGGQPLQYLMGQVEFMGFKLRVKPGVLIPRPETEILVEEALRVIARQKIAGPRILDIGTGSGNIAIALAKLLDHSSIFSVDISGACLKVALANARDNHVEDKIKFIQADMFDGFARGSDDFDFIISNPPYIPIGQYEELPIDVRCEPREALLAKNNGLYFYSGIEKGARDYLARGGFIFLEIGDGQRKAIGKIFSTHSLWKEVKFIKDYNGIDRVAVIRKT